jgi:hypothetical protein
VDERVFKAEVMSWPGVVDFAFTEFCEPNLKRRVYHASAKLRDGNVVAVAARVSEREIGRRLFLVGMVHEEMVRDLKTCVRKALRPGWMSPAVEGLLREWDGNGFDMSWPGVAVLADALMDAGYAVQEHLDEFRKPAINFSDTPIYEERFWARWQARNAVFTPALECGVVEGPTFGVQSARGGLSS